MDTPSATWTHPELAREPVAWLGTSGPDGQAALVPTWFAWDGAAFLVASKPGARKVRNAVANPRVMLGIARVGVEMEAQLVEGCAEVLPVESASAFRGVDLAKYEELLAADGLTWDAFFARYSAVIRIVPIRFLPWQGPALARADAAPGPAGTAAAPAARSSRTATAWRRPGISALIVDLARRLAPRPAFSAAGRPTAAAS